MSVALAPEQININELGSAEAGIAHHNVSTKRRRRAPSGRKMVAAGSHSLARQEAAAGAAGKRQTGPLTMNTLSAALVREPPGNAFSGGGGRATGRMAGAEPRATCLIQIGSILCRRGSVVGELARNFSAPTRRVRSPRLVSHRLAPHRIHPSISGRCEMASRAAARREWIIIAAV